MTTCVEGLFRYAIKLKLEEDLTRYSMIYTMEGLLELNMFYITYAPSRRDALDDWAECKQRIIDIAEGKANIPLNITATDVLGPYDIDESELHLVGENNKIKLLYPRVLTEIGDMNRSFLENDSKVGDYNVN